MAFFGDRFFCTFTFNNGDCTAFDIIVGRFGKNQFILHQLYRNITTESSSSNVSTKLCKGVDCNNLAFFAVNYNVFYYFN